MPSEVDLAKHLKVGMTDEEVIAVFGKPCVRFIDPQGVVKQMTYILAPERVAPDHEMKLNGFSVEFQNGKVSSWSGSWSTVSKRGKPKGKNLRRLIGKAPDFEMTDERFGLIRWVEGWQLSLKKGETEPHAQDYADLLSWIHSAASVSNESDSIDANCPVVEILAKLPEVSALRKVGEEKLNLFKLRDALNPYIQGEKLLPGVTGAEK